MTTPYAHQVRRSKRTIAKARASLVVDLVSHPKRIPCLIVDRSAEGFRVRLSFRLKQEQAVEVIFNDDPLHSVRCNVVWVGRSGSKHEGEIGLQVQLAH
ncbi:MAG TPA: PilZ domain-containing protein [Candidatus Acidoferrum sp.]